MSPTVSHRLVAARLVFFWFAPTLLPFRSTSLLFSLLLSSSYFINFKNSKKVYKEKPETLLCHTLNLQSKQAKFSSKIFNRKSPAFDIFSIRSPNIKFSANELVLIAQYKIASCSNLKVLICKYIFFFCLPMQILCRFSKEARLKKKKWIFMLSLVVFFHIHFRRESKKCFEFMA